MHKIMGLDVGTKRIGVALSDFLHVIASGYCCVQREPEKDAIENIKKIISENKVETVVIGIPLNMDGTAGFQADNCKSFGEKLTQAINNIKIIYEDERLTSELAEENLKERNINFRKDKSMVDIESARIILEQFLQKNGN